jgi:hypothetical protein
MQTEVGRRLSRRIEQSRLDDSDPLAPSQLSDDRGDNK